ncbi:MAG: rhodanese-like domain-containing protein [Candidatus Nitrohelix vancouverensis]|uniref:Rhodanese-like domain-containing protein n=1 Tax=Candidatus Nitrohelix vancouverensis TaxID=2705534 RepID=A0A7T0C587_9BACT|nr:MAG: rhodanese-like domain-containing protein [Candidatus Nitrohelix vancouverensis]
MEIISISELHDRLEDKKDNDLVLDVRSRSEFNEGHIDNAQNTPHDDVEAISEELKQYDTVYVHCKMGGRAKLASQTLERLGLDNIVCVGDGGMEAWQKNGWPVVS